MVSESAQVLVVLCCQYLLSAHHGVVSSLALVPSVRRSRVDISAKHGHPRPGSSFALFGTGHGRGERTPKDGDVITFQDEKRKNTEITDGLDVEQFQADLEVFSIEEAARKADQCEDAMPLETSIIPWKFKGLYDIYAEVTRPPSGRMIRQGLSPGQSRPLPAVLLVHGLGCSSFYWRHTARTLALRGHTVYATDLLGHGRSAQPTSGVEYSTQLWAEQLDDFVAAHLVESERLVLVGNSVGSLVALLAATGTFAGKPRDGAAVPGRLAGIGMFNCGIGLNVRGIARDPRYRNGNQTSY